MALSNAERQRRYIERLKAGSVTNGASVTPVINESVTNGNDPYERIAELRGEVDKLKEALAIVGNKALAYERARRDRIMDRATYRQILARLHPDGAQDDETKQRLTPLFSRFKEVENWICLSEAEEKANKQEESAARLRAHWDAMERQAAAKRKAKREAAKAKREAAANSQP